MSWYTWDIETGPLPDEQLIELMPEFDAAEVKCGNLKDPAKIDAKIAEVAANHKQQFFDKAALSPATGRIVAIGHYDVHRQEFQAISSDDEAEMIATFWELLELLKRQDANQAGVNIFGFDLPFLVKRSWIIGLKVPHWVCRCDSQWPNWHPMFVDLRLTWQLGDRSETSNFDHIGKALGTGGKIAGDHGKEFHLLWQNDRPKAMEYLKNDCEQPAIWLRKMGMI